MKKWFVIFLVAIFLFWGLVYFFIPGELIISKVIIINCTPNGATRQVSLDSQWKKNWIENNSAFSSKQKHAGITDTFSISEKLNNGVEILISGTNMQLQSTVELFPKGVDSVIFQWRSSITSGWNPVTRITKYMQAVDIKKNMDAVTENIRTFLQNPDNVYGMVIRKYSTTDSVLVATKYITPASPTTSEVYGFLKPLRQYINEQGAVETGKPMLNITKLEDNQFQSMVAIPINKQLPPHGNIFPKRLIRGNFMVAEIHGGLYTVNKALEKMDVYFADYGRTSMAIPFQSLITDRSKEPDTAKWITKIYAPVYQ